MSLDQILIYLALALLLVSTFIPTIIWLRLVALAANVVIVLWGLLTTDYVIAVLGLALIAVNAWRLMEMRRLVSITRQATAASGAPLTLDWLLPFMRPLAIPADTVLFHKDAPADAMYFVSHGRVRFEELGIEMGKGALFGEIGIFSHDKRRTATAKVIEDSSLLLISDEKVRELYFQNPEFGFFIVGLITRRLMEDAAAGTLRP
ncbi:MAG: cyclic nucleotide-binding domain-containing protein [Bauldia sp.]|nr:cyclic nucleotide-binding domain-containing protein [Bauldia sp.]